MPAEIDRDYLNTRPTKAAQRLVSHTLLQGRPLTTSGRWLNGPLFASYALAKAVPMPRTVDRPIFVLGTGRSGTTILGKVLSMHRHCAFLNEPKALWHAAYRGEDVIGSYTDGDARYTLNASDADERTVRRIRRLYRYALMVTASKRLVDKYPEMLFRVPFVRRCFPDARLVFLQRDGNDTLTSITKWSQREGETRRGHTDDWWGRDRRKWRLLVRDVVPQDEALRDRADALGALTRHEDMAAVEWVLTMRWGQRVAAMDGPVHVVRFEDLCASPRATLGALGDFCGLPTDERYLAYAQRTLSPVPARSPVALDPVIADVFTQTMRDLGYER